MLLRWAPGALPRWVSWVIATVCAVTIGGVAIGADLIASQVSTRVGDLAWFRHGLTIAVAMVVALSYAPPWRLSRLLRVALFLPLAHVLVIVAGWPMWLAVSRHVIDPSSVTDLLTQFPLAKMVAIGSASFLAVALLAAPRRKGEWAQGFAMLALAELLLLGLWLPLLCAAWPERGADWWSSDVPLIENAPSLIMSAVIPPTVIALGFMVIMLRWPGMLLARRRLLVEGMIGLFGFAVIARLGSDARSMLIYSNMLPLLLAAMIVAIIALGVLCVAIVARSRTARRQFAHRERTTGTVEVDDDEPAVVLEISSWLRGPRVVQRPFAIVTAQGTIPVSGVELVAPIPATTTQLKIGEAAAVLQAGDRVELAGHRAASGDPFRTSAAPLADALYVAPLATLKEYRPC